MSIYVPERVSLLVAGMLLASPAFSADLPVRAAPVLPPLPPVFTWTGFYAGVNGGYGFDAGRRSTDPVFVPGAGVVFPSNRRREGGFVGGGQIGYLQQFTPGSGFVVGVEGDGQYVGRERRRGRLGGVTFGRRDDDGGLVATFRARLGYAVDRFLVYGTSGLAIGDLRRDPGAAGFALVPNGPATFDGRRDRIKTGFVAGAGVEYAVTDNVSVRVEGLYVNLDEGKRRATTVFVPGTAAPVNLRRRGEDGDIAIVRAGLNYRF
ncbi:outer membrane protein [Methylobacterium iners]|uniref:Outer membrane protein beta-barrel domain-containing protein n=1 Tax=Methylobacterium iners TaxID=418707 RepID=A0ABQ4RS40_9HYPH|nr:outer membrane beta-barrel protein [Methylobacterium iners]GJD93601.1 hypothetical protein OCOJLMKI_0797 [Methylobacterium iners]